MKLLRFIINSFVKFIGDIKIFKWPFFMVYDPSTYLVKGADVREVLDIIKPGDILLRGYNNYLDGYIIPGYFSHAGLYLGEIKPGDIRKVKTEEGKKIFTTGKQMVIHSMAEGVFVEDILNFCRCDRMMIVRFPKKFTGIKILSKDEVAYNEFTKSEIQIFNLLNQKKQVVFTSAFRTIYDTALSQLGKKYDFLFNFKNYNTLSCTEFVQYCIKSMEAFHNLKPLEKKFFIFNRTAIIPEAFLRVNLETIWSSKSVDEKVIMKIKSQPAE